MAIQELEWEHLPASAGLEIEAILSGRSFWSIKNKGRKTTEGQNTEKDRWKMSLSGLGLRLEQEQEESLGITIII